LNKKIASVSEEQWAQARCDELSL